MTDGVSGLSSRSSEARHTGPLGARMFLEEKVGAKPRVRMTDICCITDIFTAFGVG